MNGSKINDKKEIFERDGNLHCEMHSSCNIPTSQLRLVNIFIAFLTIGTVGNILVIGKRLSGLSSREILPSNHESSKFLRTSHVTHTTNSDLIDQPNDRYDDGFKSANRPNIENSVDEYVTQKHQQQPNLGDVTPNANKEDNPMYLSAPKEIMIVENSETNDSLGLPDLNKFDDVLHEQHSTVEKLGHHITNEQPLEYKQALEQIEKQKQSGKPEGLDMNFDLTPLPPQIIDEVSSHDPKVQELKNEILELYMTGKVTKQDHSGYFDRLKLMDEQQELMTTLQKRHKGNQEDMQQNLQNQLLQTNMLDTTSLDNQEDVSPAQMQEEQNEVLMKLQQELLALQAEEPKQIEMFSEQNEQKTQDLQNQEQSLQQQQAGINQLGGTSPIVGGSSGTFP